MNTTGSTSLNALKPLITEKAINDSTGKGTPTLEFLRHLHSNTIMRGWIYDPPRINKWIHKSGGDDRLANGNEKPVVFGQDKRNRIGNAIKSSQGMVEKTIRSLGANTASDKQHFEEWFGTRNDTAYGVERLRIKRDFEAILKALTNLIISDDPSDRDGLASAEQSEKMNVFYVLDDFWYKGSASPGTSRWRDEVLSASRVEQAQTVIHELSHKYANPKTDDIPWNTVTASAHSNSGDCYGPDECKELAGIDPAKAINNADSVGFFAVAIWERDLKAAAAKMSVFGRGSNLRVREVGWDTF